MKKIVWLAVLALLLPRPYVSGVPFMTGMNRVAAEKAVLDVMAQ